MVFVLVMMEELMGIGTEVPFIQPILSWGSLLWQHRHLLPSKDWHLYVVLGTSSLQ